MLKMQLFIVAIDNPHKADLKGLLLLCVALVARKRLEDACTIYPWQEVFEVLKLE